MDNSISSLILGKLFGSDNKKQPNYVTIKELDREIFLLPHIFSTLKLDYLKSLDLVISAKTLLFN